MQLSSYPGYMGNHTLVNSRQAESGPAMIVEFLGLVNPDHRLSSVPVSKFLNLTKAPSFI